MIRKTCSCGCRLEIETDMPKVFKRIECYRCGQKIKMENTDEEVQPTGVLSE